MEGRDSSHVTLASQPNARVVLDVGGKLFETTVATLQSGGPDSLLAALCLRANPDSDEEPSPVFIDRDPEIFSTLLSLLRSGRLPSSVLSRFSNQDLLGEALYYGVEARLRSALSPPPLVGFDATLVATLRPASDAFPTALSAGSEDGSVWIAHGGQISAYDWSLADTGTVRTHLDEITALQRVWPEVAAAGSLDSPGLHFYDVSGGRHVGSVHWSDPGDHRVYKARVTAIAAGWSGPDDPVYAAFECPHPENCILAVDPATLLPTAAIGRQSGSAAKAAAPGRLVHVRERGLVFAAAVSAGAFGYAGYMRLWDPRSGEAVWETNEPGAGSSSRRFGDSFADADVDREGSAIYKVCWRSGDVAVADMRRLGEDPWVYLEERSAAAGMRSAGEGANSVLRCYKNQVFVGREAGLEVWSQIMDKEGGRRRSERETEAAVCENAFRRIFVDKEEDARRGLIKAMEGGGDRLFLSREGVEGVEVWESSDLSRAISLV
ncbi:protein ENDOPLASMIC RETICULUM-ARRESTED PEN3 [Musa acuminata AAA Group]|uniref:protein ENDOPLASMIC RETICULUM-ARRESTED PEN3 n=1 Tax=Musa acuminata AAA Group TaxID=214697 RepID=UPI0031DBA932